MTIIPGTLHEDIRTFVKVSPKFFLETEISRKNIVVRIKTKFYIQYFPENCSVCKTMWEKTVDSDRPQVTIQ
jgi:hypothetical protein